MTLQYPINPSRAVLLLFALLTTVVAAEPTHKLVPEIDDGETLVVGASGPAGSVSPLAGEQIEAIRLLPGSQD